MNARNIISGRWVSRRLNRFRGLPPWAIVELTNRCNLRCANCRSLVRESDFLKNGRDMSSEAFQVLLKKLPFVERFQFLGLGEPLLNPHLFEIISQLSQKGKSTIVNTNTTLLGEDACVRAVESGLTKLYFSVDSADPDTFEQLRAGASFHKVIENVRTMVEVKRRLQSETPHLALCVVISKENQGELKEILHLACSLEIPAVRLMNLSAPVTELKARKVPASARRRIRAELRQVAQRLGIRLDTFGDGYVCPTIFRSVSITVDCHVTPCFFAYYANPMSMQFGNLLEDDFRSIWDEPQYKRLRSAARKAFRGASSIPACCAPCRGEALP